MQYSYGGYLAALKQRRRRTLLVEGRTDKVVWARVAAELPETCPDVVIDTAEMINSQSPFGNRGIVEDIHRLAREQQLALAAWVDREFRHFDFVATIRDSLEAHKVVDGNLFWTRGHSTENYFFCERRIARFLRYQFSDRLPSEWEQALSAYFADVLRWAAALSIAAYESSCLHRMRDLLTDASWRIASGCELQWSQINTSLGARNVSDAIVGTIEARSRHLFAQFRVAELELAQWACHGHVGENCIWSATAALLANIGADSRLVSDVLCGFKDEKLRHAADTWSVEITSSTGELPHALMNWLSSQRCPTPSSE